jgi:hypothetical protein
LVTGDAAGNIQVLDALTGTGNDKYSGPIEQGSVEILAGDAAGNIHVLDTLTGTGNDKYSRSECYGRFR